MVKEQCNELVAACRRGERQAFDSLVSLFEKPVFNAVFRMLHNYEEARDVTQTVFMKAFEKIHSYDESYKFFSWIYRIAINESINFQAGKKDFSPLDPEIQADDDPERDAKHDELGQQLQAALMRLSEEQRSVVVLKYLMEFSYAEIADVLELPEKTVKSRLYDARERLKGLLNQEALL